MTSIPPPLPGTPYTSCYCEENIYLLAQAFLSDPLVVQKWDIFAVFISNQSKTVALWSQKRAQEPTSAVVWDYHVVLLLRQHEELRPSRISFPVASPADAVMKAASWVYDFDTRLPLPCTLQGMMTDYLMNTFTDVPPQFESLFRIVPGDVLLKHFASDRSHMLVRGGISISQADDRGSGETYISPPPVYQPIHGVAAAEKGVLNNLMSGFVDMVSSERTFGHVLDREALSMWK